MTYLYEEFRGENSSILIEYNSQYIKQRLNQKEINLLSDLLEHNNNIKLHQDIFASLIILIKEILKDNYEQNYFIHKIIENLPKNIFLNQEFIDLIKRNYENNNDNEKVFTVNSLISIYEYFESLCWEENEENIMLDYKLDLPDNIKKYVTEYFEKIINGEKIINRKNFTTALRRLMFRNMLGIGKDNYIRPDYQLKMYIIRNDLWNEEIREYDLFEKEINDICLDKIKICYIYNLYNILDGNKILFNEINKIRFKKEKDQNRCENEYESEEKDQNSCENEYESEEEEDMDYLLK